MRQQSAVQALASGGLIDAGAFTHWDHLHAAVYELGFLALMLLFVLQQHPNNLCWPDKILRPLFRSGSQHKDKE